LVLGPGMLFQCELATYAPKVSHLKYLYRKIPDGTSCKSEFHATELLLSQPCASFYAGRYLNSTKVAEYFKYVFSSAESGP
jgi:hypothetical protein